MEVKDKALLIKDLSGRLPYGVYVEHIRTGMRGHLHDLKVYPLYDKTDDHIYDYICTTDFLGDGDYFDIEAFKPLLFPLSSMTEEQKRELRQMDAFINTFGNVCFAVYDEYGHDIIPTYEDAIRITNWLNKNHFDYRGLIEKGLAIDATDKNIY